LIVYLNTNNLCIEVPHGAKSTLGKLEPWTAIGGSTVNFWDLVAIPDERLGATAWSQSSTMNEREKIDHSSSYFQESASTTTLDFPFL
jgi:hypothetical protein